MLAEIITYVVLAGVLIAAAITDVRSGKVYNALTYPAMLGALIAWSAVGYAQGGIGEATRLAVACLFGLFAGAVPFAMLRSLGGLHGGDVKLMGAVGAVTASWEVVLSTTVYAFIAGALVGVVVMIRRRVVRRTLFRVVRALFLAATQGKTDLDEQTQIQVPFAACIAVGGLLAGAEQLLGLPTPWAWLNP